MGYLLWGSTPQAPMHLIYLHLLATGTAALWNDVEDCHVVAHAGADGGDVLQARAELKGGGQGLSS